MAQVQATLRKRILRAFVAQGLLENAGAKHMLAYQHSGFSVDAGVCIEAHDRAAQVKDAWGPKSRAIFALMRSNFLFVNGALTLYLLMSPMHRYFTST